MEYTEEDLKLVNVLAYNKSKIARDLADITSPYESHIASNSLLPEVADNTLAELLTRHDSEDIAKITRLIISIKEYTASEQDE